MKQADYASIIKNICVKLSIAKPDDTLIRNVILYIKGLDQKYLNDTYSTNDEIYEHISKAYVQTIEPNETIDFKAFVHNQHKETPSSHDSLTEWLSINMPKTASKSMSLYIDSRVRSISMSYPTITDFLFNLVPRSTRAQLGDGRIQVRIMPSQITYLKIGKIMLPYSQSMRRRNYTNEITLTFTALRSNGIIAREDTYHFAFTYKASTNPDLVELCPVNEYCKFNPPLRILDDISLRFNDPIYPIKFPKDRIYPSQFNYQSTDGRISFDQPHNLSTDDVIIISELLSLDNANDSEVLSLVNDQRGIVITVINSTTISTGIDFTLFKSPDIDNKPLILLYSKMFRFPLEIGYQDQTEI